jgi:hypothetical protein
MLLDALSPSLISRLGCVGRQVFKRSVAKPHGVVRILDHSEAVVAVNHFSVGAARAAQRKVLEGIIN